jgi:methionine synthase II (cobalamin-independent)
VPDLPVSDSEQLSLPPTVLGGATGIGSMPGTDPAEAAAIVAGELPDLPHLPELPARGPGADLVGRTAALLPELPVELHPSGWRLTARPGVDVRRAGSYLSQDLDALEEALQDRVGPVKVALAGPWTLAAAVQLPRGEPVLSDLGARRDLVQALSEAIAGHLDDVRRRFAGGPVVLQLDEPGLPAVLAGQVPSFSGSRRLGPVAELEVIEALASLVSTAGEAGVPVVMHCCAAEPPVDLFRRAGALGVSLDVPLVGKSRDDELGEALESGVALLAGVVPAVDAPLSDPTTTVEPVRRLWDRLGLPAETTATRVVVTPTCGMAGASSAHAVLALRRAREAARTLHAG